ncbi:MAG: hypothetical protein LBK60_03770 [Verrucomicrobiales bacterium]|jgi:hypothetical protein|nr:hypothetical protein [Verrucomicrobiales bacterium]
MGKSEKILADILSGRKDQPIRFTELVHLLGKLGFTGRVKGGHHIYWRDGVEEILNLQPLGSQAKPYQVKQVRNLIIKYHLEAI